MKKSGVANLVAPLFFLLSDITDYQCLMIF